MTHFDRSLVKALLKGFTPGEQHYTHHFEFLDISSFKGKDNRPMLRKYLRHLEGKGYIKNHNLGNNIHQWSITQDGIETLALLQSDSFIK
jgi:hypothetical protein